MSWQYFLSHLLPASKKKSPFSLLKKPPENSFLDIKRPARKKIKKILILSSLINGWQSSQKLDLGRISTTLINIKISAHYKRTENLMKIAYTFRISTSTRIINSQGTNYAATMPWNSRLADPSQSNRNIRFSAHYLRSQNPIEFKPFYNNRNEKKYLILSTLLVAWEFN